MMTGGRMGPSFRRVAARHLEVGDLFEKMLREWRWWRICCR